VHYYEKALQQSRKKIRKQSAIPAVATKALRKLANYFGRGRKVKRKLTPGERMQSEVTQINSLWNLIFHQESPAAARIPHGLLGCPRSPTHRLCNELNHN